MSRGPEADIFAVPVLGEETGGRGCRAITHRFGAAVFDMAHRSSSCPEMIPDPVSAQGTTLSQAQRWASSGRECVMMQRYSALLAGVGPCTSSLDTLKARR